MITRDHQVAFPIRRSWNFCGTSIVIFRFFGTPTTFLVGTNDFTMLVDKYLGNKAAGWMQVRLGSD